MCSDLRAARALMIDFKPLVQLVIVKVALLTIGGKVAINKTKK